MRCTTKFVIVFVTAATVATGIAGCGGSPPQQVAASTQPAASTPPAAAVPDGPLSTADHFIAAWRAGDLQTMRALATNSATDDPVFSYGDSDRLVDRGCVQADQIPGTKLGGAATICVYGRPFRGEVRVGLTESAGTWRVVGVEVV
ncbi:MAG TPA: hypothetical protein VGJ03_09135 [Acidimicrobiales bacterium]|jgi:hypothetical protein